MTVVPVICLDDKNNRRLIPGGRVETRGIASLKAPKIKRTLTGYRLNAFRLRSSPV